MKITVKTILENNLNKERPKLSLAILSLLFEHRKPIVTTMQGLFSAFYAQYYQNITVWSLIHSYLVEFSKLNPDAAGSRTQESAMSRM